MSFENINLENLGGLGEAIKKCAEDAAKKMFVEMFEDYENNKKLQLATISSDELCDQWGISKNTLHNYEKEGIITPIPTCGRRKMYSMNDVMEAQMTNPKLNKVRA